MSSKVSVTGTVKAGSSVRATAQQMVDAGVPINPTLFTLLVRATGQGGGLCQGDIGRYRK